MADTPDMPFGKPHVVNGDEDAGESYDPSTAEVNRGLEQGLGVGARDLAAQDTFTEGSGEDDLDAAVPDVSGGSDS